MQFLVLNSKQYVLLEMNNRKLTLNHEIISEIVLFNAVLSPPWLELITIMLVSSVKSTTLASLSVVLGKSLIQIRKSNGPKNEPRGTEFVTFFHLEEILSYALILF